MRKKDFSKKAQSKREVMDLVYDLEDLGEMLQEAVYKAQDIRYKADSLGGEIERVVGGQLHLYLIGHLKSFVENEHQPGSVRHLISFLENWIKEEYIRRHYEE